MKKRILAILLAGLITASLSSCVTSSKRPDIDGTQNTEDTQTRPQDPDDNTVNQPPVTVTWEDADDYVFIITDNLSLTPVAEGGQAVTADLMEKLLRVKISSDGKRSIVEKDSVQYYVNNTSVSTEDLLGENFEECDITMYSKEDNVNMRPYASTDNSFSTSGKGLSKGDEVKVVAKGAASGLNWCKIVVADPETDAKTYYFVAASLLSINPNGESVDYSQFFTSCDATTMYVTSTSLNLRTSPDTSEGSDNIAGTLAQHDEVLVIAKGTGAYESWYYVKVANPKEDGMAQTYSKYYVFASYLTDVKENMTLDEMIEKYGFTREEKTLYATGNINVRKTPSAENNSNIVNPGLAKTDAVKIVASGLVDGKLWSIFEYSEGTYYFVRNSYELLTTDPSGEILPTLEALIAENPGFEEIEPTKIYSTSKTYGFTSLDSSPTVADAKLTIEGAGTELTAVAQGTKFDADWYIVEGKDGTYYFVFVEFFTTDAPAAG